MVAILIALFFISILYSSVGHGGASGYLAILSLTTFATMSDVWLKQHAWMLNLVVAAIALVSFAVCVAFVACIVSSKLLLLMLRACVACTLFSGLHVALLSRRRFAYIGLAVSVLTAFG